jgi:hypothetical protein
VSTVTTLSSTDAVDVVGTRACLRDTPSADFAGSRAQPHRLAPFALGGIGVAHLTPSARFTFSDGLLPITDPSPRNRTRRRRDDRVVALGVFTPPPSSKCTELTAAAAWSLPSLALGGGHGFRVSRISARLRCMRRAGVRVGIGFKVPSSHSKFKLLRQLGISFESESRIPFSYPIGLE